MTWQTRIVGEGEESPEHLLANPRNWRIHPKNQQQALAAVLDTVGWVQRVIVNQRTGFVVDGHLRVALSLSRGEAKVPVVYVDLSPEEEALVLAALDPLAGMAATDDEKLRELVQDVKVDDEELAKLLGLTEDRPQAGDPDDVPEPPVEPITKPGDLWLLGEHRLLCGDARDPGDVAKLVGTLSVGMAFTSPPYAEQRDYDETSPFRPVPPDAYVEWFAPVAANVATHLAADGSWLVNIKEHADDGQRVLYVKDLTIAHVRSWGWRFVDEFCWARGGVPGAWPNRFKNGWEPVFHFTRNAAIKFHPDAVARPTRHAFDYSKANGKSVSGSGLLGKEHGTRFHDGVALPSNVVEVGTGGAAVSGEHPAEFPVALPAWFMQVFSDTGDTVFDPFVGSGSTLIAAEMQDRLGLGMEISPAYCDVIVKRWETFTGKTAVLDDGITDEVIDAFVESH